MTSLSQARSCKLALKRVLLLFVENIIMLFHRWHPLAGYCSGFYRRVFSIILSHPAYKITQFLEIFICYSPSTSSQRVRKSEGFLCINCDLQLNVFKGRLKHHVHLFCAIMKAVLLGLKKISTVHLGKN